MKNERLLIVFGQIDESYVLDAKPKLYLNEMREQTMKTKKITAFLRRPMAAAAALAILVCIAGTTALATAGKMQGFFEDIFNRNGAVVGTSYTQASDEVILTVITAGDQLVAEMTMTAADKLPYRDLEMLGIQNYRILDRNNQVITETASANAVQIVNGKASVQIPLNQLPDGSYTLVISELLGVKKADQPLTLSGSWEAVFETGFSK